MRKELLFSSLLLLGVLGCTPDQIKDTSTNDSAGTRMEPDLEDYMRKTPEFKEIYERIRQQDHGLILFSVENAKFTTWVKLTRIDIAENPQETKLSPWISPSGQPQPSSSIFLATSCNGEYRIDITLDGQSYQNVPVPDLNNKEPRETFKLRPSCMRPVTFTVIP